jgi:hypothetical protein
MEDDERAASEGTPNVKIKRWVYVTLGTLAWFAPLAVVSVQAALPASRTMASENLLVALSVQAVALLTYPAGAVGMLATLPAIYLGIATPAEAMVVAGPISLAAGYLQWFVVIPRLFGRTPDIPPKTAEDASHLAPPA